MKISEHAFVVYDPESNKSEINNFWDEAKAWTVGLIMRPGAVIYRGVSFGINLHVGHNALIREDNVIGNNVSIGSFACLEPGNTIGDGTRIHSHAFVVSATIGKNVFIGPGVKFTDDPHPACPKYKECKGGAHVGDNVSIGAGAIILPGVKIGDNALIGAGAIVVEDVPAGAVIATIPAGQIGWIGDLRCAPGHFTRPYGWRLTSEELNEYTATEQTLKLYKK